MRQYQPSDTFKLPNIAPPMNAKDILDTPVDTNNNSKTLIIPTMKIFGEDSPTLDYGGNETLKHNPRSSYSEGLFTPKAAPNRQNDTEENLKSLHSRFNYEHFSGNSKRNIPSQPELIRLLSETDIDTREKHEKDDNKTNASDKSKDKKQKCDYCRMTNGKHKQWCIVHLESQKAKDNMKFTERGGSFRKNWKRVSFGESSYHAFDGTEKAKASSIMRTPQLIRSSTTLDGLNIKSDRHDFSSLHRDVYIQALAESRARRVTKLKNAYNFSTQSSRPFLFSYFDNLTGPSNRLKKDFDCMKHILGDVKVDKYYDRLAGKAHGKGFYTKP